MSALLLMIPLRSAAATYYVANAGNDANPGSLGAPWKTLARASAAPLRPGDQVLLHAGDSWHETWMIAASGDVSAPIVFGTYGAGAAPVILGAGLDYGIVLASRSYLVFNGISLKGQTKSGILAYQARDNSGADRTQNEFITLTNITLSAIGDTAGDPVFFGEGGIFVRGMDLPHQYPLRGWVISGVDCGDMNLRPVLDYNQACLQIQSTTGAQITQSHIHAVRGMGIQLRPFFRNPASDSNRIDHNTLTNNQGNITAWGTGNIVSANSITDSFGFGVQIGPGGSIVGNIIQHLRTSQDGTLYNGIDTNNAPGVTIEGNTILDVAGCSLTLEQDSPRATVSGNTLDAGEGPGGCLTYIMATAVPGLRWTGNVLRPSSLANAVGFNMTGPGDRAHRYSVSRFGEVLGQLPRP